jgi:hypothetical protein
MFSRTISAPNQRNPDSCEDFDFSRQEVEQRTSNAQAYFDLFSSNFFARILNIFYILKASLAAYLSDPPIVTGT